MSPVTVVSVDGSPYLAWQVTLLEHSHARVGQPGEMLVLSDTVNIEGDHYPPYNKPYAISRWLQRTRPQCDAVLVVDPDMVFVQAYAKPVRRGRPVATDSRYRVDGLLEIILKSYTSTPEMLQPIAVPMLIHPDDLRDLAELWFSYTISLRADPVVRAVASWICEMWACSLAAQRLGLVFDIEHASVLPPADQHLDAPFVHYAWAFDGFDKRTYRPWDLIPAGPSEASGYLRELIGTLPAG